MARELSKATTTEAEATIKAEDAKAALVGRVIENEAGKSKRGPAPKN